MSSQILSAEAMDGTAYNHSLSGIDTSGCDPVKTKRTEPYRPWQEIAAAKKAEQLSRIPKDWILPDTGLPTDAVDLRPIASLSGILSARELEITGESYDATALLAKIADGTYTSVEVVTAFCKRAAVAQQVCNCLTEIMFADAIAAAGKLDEEYNRTGTTAGPLHGLPMTFKVSMSLNHTPMAWAFGHGGSLHRNPRNASTSKATMPRMDTYPGLLIPPPPIPISSRLSELPVP